MEPHPVRLVVDDDLERSRLTVFFRILLAIPHLIWVALWTVAVAVLAVIAWVGACFTGRLHPSFHGFFCSYIRYTTHLSAYIGLVAAPYPPFIDGRYPVTVNLPAETVAQKRWTVVLRFFLAVPALLLSAGLAGSGGLRVPRGTGSSGTNVSVGGGALSGVAAFLAWFAVVFAGRMPKGLRDAGAYGVGYSAQASAYLLLVTDRYPNSDPTEMLVDVERPPEHPVHLVGDEHDLRRSRVTVLFRILLAIPHLVWLVLWSVAATVAVIVQWFVTLFAGRPARGLHAFLARFVRYAFHVGAFVYLAGNPFPGFTGLSGRYPLDIVLPDPAPQSRWKTGFRFFLTFPAFLLRAAMVSLVLVAAILMWFAALFTGRIPSGLRNVVAYGLRYGAQLDAYLLLLTDAYPNASPLEGAQADREPAPEPIGLAPRLSQA